MRKQINHLISVSIGEMENCMNELYEQKLKKTRLIWIIAIVTGILIIAAVSGYFLLRYRKQQMYSRYIDEADQYYASKQYEEAIASYKEAVKIDNTQYRPYEGAGQSYIEMARYSEARVFLKEGMGKTDSQELIALYDRIKDAPDGIALESLEANPGKEETVAVDNTMVANVGSFTYKQYTSTYGEGTVSMDKNTCIINYDKLNAKAYYEDTTGASIINKATGRPFDGQVPSYLVFMDMSKIFPQWDEGVDFYTLQKLVNNTAEINENNGYYTVVFDYLNCRFEIECDSEGNINDIEADNKVYPLAVSAAEDMGTVMGSVIDAKTGLVLEEVTIRVIDGTDSETGKIIQEALTDSNGDFSLQAPAGEYTVEYSKEGYQTAVNDDKVMVSAGANENLSQKVLMPNLGDGEWSIVLQWGSEPQDLDLHVSSDDYHVFFSNPQAKGKNNEEAILDVDDQNGDGPETITITNMQPDSSYLVMVDNYSYRGHGGDHTLSESQATVTIYSPTGETFSYSVPDGMGNIWNVVEIKNGELRDINTVVRGDATLG